MTESGCVKPLVMVLGKLKRRHRRRQRQLMSELSGVDMTVPLSVKKTHKPRRARHRKHRFGTKRRRFEKAEKAVEKALELEESGEKFKSKAVRNLMKTGMVFSTK